MSRETRVRLFQLRTKQRGTGMRLFELRTKPSETGVRPNGTRGKIE
jgi:hypothetical protein